MKIRHSKFCLWDFWGFFATALLFIVLVLVWTNWDKEDFRLNLCAEFIGVVAETLFVSFLVKKFFDYKESQRISNILERKFRRLNEKFLNLSQKREDVLDSNDLKWFSRQIGTTLEEIDRLDIEKYQPIDYESINQLRQSHDDFLYNVFLKDQYRKVYLKNLIKACDKVFENFKTTKKLQDEWFVDFIDSLDKLYKEEYNNNP